MSHKKTRAGRNRKNSAPVPGSQMRIPKGPVRSRPLWQKVLRLTFYVIMSAFILVGTVHAVKRYIHLVSQH